MRWPRDPALLSGGKPDLDGEISPAVKIGGVIGPLPDEEGRLSGDEPGEEPVTGLDGQLPDGAGDLQ
jgi:hypothetical protein